MKRFLAWMLLAGLMIGLVPLALAEGEEAVTADVPSEPVIEEAVLTPEPVPGEEQAAEPTAASEPTSEPTAIPEATTIPEETPVPEGIPVLEPIFTPEPTAEPTATPEPSPEPTLPADAPVAIEFDPDACVTMGADLTARQREAVYADFGIVEGSALELTVTNDEERAYLEGLVPDRRIGTVALSCIYIKLLAPGSGLDISVHNIDFCTEDTYRSALRTAGIIDARVIVSAPFPVSGTGALAGAYKAYEYLTGNSLDTEAKNVGTEELVLTGELAEQIGSTEATRLIAELKQMLDKTQKMTDEAVRKEIRSLSETYGYSLTSLQVNQVLKLVRRLEGLDEAQLKTELKGLTETTRRLTTTAETASGLYENVRGFFSSVGSFFTDIFGG